MYNIFGLRCSQGLDAFNFFLKKIWFIEKDQVKNEVVCCYFDEESLQVIDVKDLEFAICPLRLIYIYKDRCFKV